MEEDTIAAIATPVGTGGIGIIKISGKRALNIAGDIFIPGKASGKNPDPDSVIRILEKEPRKLHHGFIFANDLKSPVDEVLLAYMKRPHSYTCEDVIEIQSHSGIAILNTIFKMVLEKGARISDPGEFTKRAFLHGRIDLTRAETVMDMIFAENETALKIASANITGELQRRIDEMILLLTDLISETEASIDFDEDTDEEITCSYVLQNVKNCILPRLNELIENHNKLNVYRDGIKIDIIGKPNVGKSSLLNILSRKDRAIVTEYPGTTRDAIEEMVPIKGMNVMLTDTAGIRNTDDPVEKIGVAKTRERLKNADLVLFVTETNFPCDENDGAVFREIEKMPYILVANKIDKLPDGDGIWIPEEWKKQGEPVYTSAITGEGIGELTERIMERVGAKEHVSRNSLVPNARQAKCLDNARKRVESAILGLETGLSLEFINIDLKECLEDLGRVVGKTTDPDILGNIFSRFCIGK